MKKELITMLTWHDVTVKNAKEIFLGAKDAPAKHWGFKIEGTTPESMKDLAACMKENGKVVYIEVLAIDEAGCLQAAKQCAECGIDHVLGTVYYDSVAEVLSDAGIAYSPFVGLSEDTHRIQKKRTSTASICPHSAMRKETPKNSCCVWRRPCRSHSALPEVSIALKNWI